MDQIIYELNGTKYLLVEELVTGKRSEESMVASLKKYKGIYQGIKEIKPGGLWTSGYVLVKCLIPEAELEAYMNENGTL